MNQLNKNISVWRGSNTPPTDYHLWEKEDGSLHTKVNEEWKELGSPDITEKIKHNILDLGTFSQSKEAEDKAAEKEVCRNSDIVIILYKVDEANGVIYQQVGPNNTLQKLTYKNVQYYRIIPVNETPSSWVQTGMDTLKWDSSNNRYDFYYLNKIVSGHTDSIPIVNESKAGLLSSELYNKINKSINTISVTSEDKNTNIVYTIKSTNNDNTTSSGTITVPKDSSVKDVQILDTNATIDNNGNLSKGNPEGDTALCIVYLLQNQSYKLAIIDLQKFLEESEFKDGLQVKEHQVSIKIDDTSENYLSVSSDGVKISGIDAKLLEINKVLYNQHSQVTLSGSPITIEKGVNTKINLSWNYEYNGEETTPTSMQLKSGNTVLESVNKTYTDTISTSKTYQVTAVNEGITKTSNTVTVGAYYSMYFGEGSEVFDRTSVITASNKRPIASNPRGDVSITFTGGKYLWLCVPDEMSINKVTSSGFAVPMEEPVNQTINETYKCYRSTDTINKGTVNFTIA